MKFNIITLSMVDNPGEEIQKSSLIKLLLCSGWPKSTHPFCEMMYDSGESFHVCVYITSGVGGTLGGHNFCGIPSPPTTFTPSPLLLRQIFKRGSASTWKIRPMKKKNCFCCNIFAMPFLIVQCICTSCIWWCNHL